VTDIQLGFNSIKLSDRAHQGCELISSDKKRKIYSTTYAELQKEETKGLLIGDSVGCKEDFFFWLVAGESFFSFCQQQGWKTYHNTDG
jgi:hypothetical protein